MSLSHWYPGSCVVLNCIDSSSFAPLLTLSSADFFQNQLVTVLNNIRPDQNVRPYLGPKLFAKHISRGYL